MLDTTTGKLDRLLKELDDLPVPQLEDLAVDVERQADELYGTFGLHMGPFEGGEMTLVYARFADFLGALVVERGGAAPKRHPFLAASIDEHERGVYGQEEDEDPPKQTRLEHGE